MKRLLFFLLWPGTLLAEPEFTAEANDMLQLCRFSWAGEARVETFSRYGNAWVAGEDGEPVVELVLYDDDIAELRLYESGEDFADFNVVCYRKEGWPMVSVMSQWFTGYKICAGGRPIALPFDSPLQLRLEQLATYSATGLMKVDTAFLLGDQRQSADAYCGPDQAMAAIHAASDFAAPGYVVRTMFEHLLDQ